MRADTIPAEAIPAEANPALGLGLCLGVGLPVPFEQRGDGLWAEVPGLDVRAMAQDMWESRVGLVTMTASILPSGGFRIVYHWSLDGRLANVAVNLVGIEIPSIADIWPAADWIEREIHDYYAIAFTGRDATPALMLRPEDEPGLFCRTQELGHDEDPADAVRPAAGDFSAEGDR